MLYSVWSLLELSDLSDDVGYLKKMCNLSWQLKVQCKCTDDMHPLRVFFTNVFSYHPHFGKVNKTFFSKIGRSLLNKGQVC